MATPKFLNITAKCSDMCDARLIDADGNVISRRNGYPPTAVGGGDYIRIEIDAQTGQIVGWKPLDETALNDEEE